MNQLSTKGRVHVIGQALALSSGAGVTTQTFTGDGIFTYVAAVDAPVNPATGRGVQATNFAFDAHYAYVVYNTAGEEVAGALEIADLSAPDHPKLSGSIVFGLAEFSDVRILGHFALLAGHRLDGAGEAALVVVDVTDPTKPAPVKTMDLTGHYATSLALDGNTAYVTTGDDGGLSVIDVTSPKAPKLLSYTPLPDALDVVRTYEQTFVLGGKPTAIYALADDKSLKSLLAISGAPLSAPSRMAAWNGALYTNAGASALRQVALTGAAPALSSLATIAGTSNGIDVGGVIAVLAQGERGTAVFDMSTAGHASSLGSFAFPDERGSANEVRFGTIGGSSYIFLGDGSGGFRIVRAAMSLADTACTASWWASTDEASWWSAPASATSESTAGTWAPAPETTAGCLVEQLEPGLSSSGCDKTILKRVRAVGPQPNEGQVCNLSCPAGTMIANAHSRYGEASTENATGSYTCTGTTTPALNEIACDAMSDSCNAGSQASCAVRYHNEYCGDPWVGCIKNGRTRWNCVATGKP